MAISMDKVPDSNPFSLPDEGFYKFTVIKAEMKQGQDLAKPPYLNLTLSLVNAAGQKCGNLFDMLSESDKPAILYKIGQFMKAVKVNLGPVVELKNLAKVIPGKQGVLEVEHRKDKDRNDREIVRAQVKLFGSECYWPLESWDELITGSATEETPVAAGDVPFNFSDEDAPVPPAPTSEY